MYIWSDLKICINCRHNIVCVCLWVHPLKLWRCIKQGQTCTQLSELMSRLNFGVSCLFYFFFSDFKKHNGTRGHFTCCAQTAKNPFDSNVRNHDPVAQSIPQTWLCAVSLKCHITGWSFPEFMTMKMRLILRSGARKSRGEKPAKKAVKEMKRPSRQILLFFPTKHFLMGKYASVWKYDLPCRCLYICDLFTFPRCLALGNVWTLTENATKMVETIIHETASKLSPVAGTWSAKWCVTSMLLSFFIYY